MNNYSSEDLKVGNFDPNVCFKFAEAIDIEKTFEYPMDCFCDEGSWDINGLPLDRCVEASITQAKTLLRSKLDEVYYIQEGERDAQSWFILGKVGNLYVHFEAACDYTGFWCRGGGSFGYSEDWKILWNMRTTASFRNLVLMYYDYQNINIDVILYNDLGYIKEKLDKNKTLTAATTC